MRISTYNFSHTYLTAQMCKHIEGKMVKNTKINDGGPVFPGQYPAEWGVAINGGLWKRDWFAGRALMGIFAMPKGSVQY